MGVDEGLRECLVMPEAGGLGGTTNCGVDGASGAADVVRVEREGQLLSAAFKATGWGLSHPYKLWTALITKSSLEEKKKKEECWQWNHDTTKVRKSTKKMMYAGNYLDRELAPNDPALGPIGLPPWLEGCTSVRRWSGHFAAAMGWEVAVKLAKGLWTFDWDDIIKTSIRIWLMRSLKSEYTARVPELQHAGSLTTTI